MDFDLQVVEETWHSLTRRETLGPPSGGDIEIKERVSLGKALIEVVEPTNGSTGSRFYLVKIRCSFRPAEPRIASATIAVRLDQAATPSSSDAIVWSMWPRLAKEDAEARQSRIRLTGALKLGAVGEASIERENMSNWLSHEPYLSSAGEGESSAEWYLIDGRGHQIEGQYDLHLVVKADYRVIPRARIAIAAEIRSRHWGIIPYRASLTTGVSSFAIRPDTESFNDWIGHDR